MENRDEIIYIRIGGGEEEETNRTVVKRREEFKQFDIIPATDDKQISNINQTSSKRIMQEWKNLEKNLPDHSIYVRAYESRIDLLTAVIIGAPGTPYHDGLFFFNIKFPVDYPNQPPKVYYVSFGFKLNPNLHDNGFVCLSLLNTWNGEQYEKWNPSESTILQVLLSIQALVLNAKPFFNGHGNDSNLDRWKNEALAYNEEVFVLSCRTMLAVINNPPSHFEDFVAQHFRDRAEIILISCKAYINGRAKVGDHPIKNTSFSSTADVLWSKKKKKKKPFQDLMGIIYSKLLLAFMKNGSSLEEYVGDNIDDHLVNNQFELNYFSIHNKRNHTIGLGELEQLDLMVTESVFRWASCTHVQDEEDEGFQ